MLPTGRVRFYLGGTSGRLIGEAQLQGRSQSTSIAILRVGAADLADGANDIIAYFSAADDSGANGPSTSLPVEVSVKP
jgi:hypothetical protein